MANVCRIIMMTMQCQKLHQTKAGRRIALARSEQSCAVLLYYGGIMQTITPGHADGLIEDLM